MPGGDGTGPMGSGPMTGWGRGWCRGGRAVRRGLGYGAHAGFGGRGRGWGRHRWWAAETPDQETTSYALATEEAALEAELKHIQRRLEKLQGNDGEEQR